MHKTSLEVDEQLVARASAILGTRGLKATVQRALEDVVAREARRSFAERLQSMQGVELDNPEVMARGLALIELAYLIDKSALARLPRASVAARLLPLMEAGQVAVSGVLALEVLYSARGHSDFLAIREELRGYPRLEIEASDFVRAADVLALLARRGQHRAAGLPDLLQAAVAERRGITLLHYDADFELIGAATGQDVEWVVPRGSVP